MKATLPILRRVKMKDRLFIAIPAKIGIFRSLQKSLMGVVEGKYSIEEQLHLTVVFLGNLWSEEEIMTKLRSVDLTFDLSDIEGIGYFDQSRVLVGLCQNESIEALRSRLCQALDMNCRKDYRLHVTLMRVRKILDRERFQNVMDDGDVPIGVLEPRLVLYRSHLSPEGARYIPLKEFAL